MTEPVVGLDHGLTDYGDRDFSRYLRRSFAQSMGYSRALLDKPVVGIAYTGVGLQQLPPPFSRTAGGGETRRAGRGRAAAGISDHLARRSVSHADQPQIPQPDGDRHRGDDPRAADGCGGADGRLRQDGAGAADGRGLRRSSGHRAGRRADDDRAVSRRAARRLHRLPAFLGALPRRRYRRRRNLARSKASSR